MALGDTKRAAAYELQKGNGRYNNSTDTFNYVLVSNTFASINANAASLDLSDLTQVASGGSYTGPTALASVTWTQASNIITLDADNITLAANASNPTTATCLVVYNDTSAADDVVQVWDLTADGTTAPSLVNGLNFNFNASGLGQVTVNP